MLSLLLSIALADVPSGPESCRIERYDEQHCEVCSTSYEAPDACETEWSAKGYEEACRSNGASVWDEIWCEEGYTEPDKGCSTVGVGGVWALLGALAVIRRRVA